MSRDLRFGFVSVYLISARLEHGTVERRDRRDPRLNKRNLSQFPLLNILFFILIIIYSFPSIILTPLRLNKK